MKSVASLMSNSTIPNNDIADLDTLLEDDEEGWQISNNKRVSTLEKH